MNALEKEVFCDQSNTAAYEQTIATASPPGMSNFSVKLTHWKVLKSIKWTCCFQWISQLQSWKKLIELSIKTQLMAMLYKR